MTITPEQLDEWERLAEAATPGPWREIRTDDESCGAVYRLVGRSDYEPDGVAVSCVMCNGDCPVMHDKDVTFITSARTAVPALVAEVRRLRAEVEQARDERVEFRLLLAAGDRNRVGDGGDRAAGCEAGVSAAMSLRVQLGYAERIMNALGRVERKRGDDFLTRANKEAAAINAVLEPVFKLEREHAALLDFARTAMAWNLSGCGATSLCAAMLDKLQDLEKVIPFQELRPKAGERGL